MRNCRICIDNSSYQKVINRRTVSLAYTWRSGETGWGSTTQPNVGQTLGENRNNYIVPYQVIHHVTSEVVTRFDLSGSTLPGIIGEVKTLAYDAGQVLELNNRKWLRCEGQTLLTEDYPQLSSFISNGKGEILHYHQLVHSDIYIFVQNIQRSLSGVTFTVT